MIDIGEVHKNTKLLLDGVPHNVVETEFMKPGKGRSIYRFKLKSLLDGRTAERTYHSGDKVEEISITSREHQYLYNEGDHYVFMDTETFEQRSINAEQLGDKKDFLKEGTAVATSMMGDQILDITLPTFVELKVVETMAGGKMATITPQNKSAILETGCTIDVPTFITEGDIIKVDTRTGSYVERVVTKK